MHWRRATTRSGAKAASRTPTSATRRGRRSANSASEPVPAADDQASPPLPATRSRGRGRAANRLPARGRPTTTGVGMNHSDLGLAQFLEMVRSEVRAEIQAQREPHIEPPVTWMQSNPDPPVTQACWCPRHKLPIWL